MSIRLLGIAFNHDVRAASTDALNLRRSATEFVPVPEWTPASRGPDDSVAAYSIADTLGRPVAIRARFQRTDPGLATAEIRAVEPTGAVLERWLQTTLAPLWLSPLHRPWLEALRRQLSGGAGAAPPAGGVLGEAEPRSVTFRPDGRSRFERFLLRDHRLWRRGVGAHLVAWQWQFRRHALAPWTDFAFTTHRIYTVLSTPTQPWLRGPHDARNTQLPWTQVLDFACRWAAGAMTLDQAAARITAAVNDLGRGVIAYDCSFLDQDGLGVSHYTTLFDLLTGRPGFFCTAFLDRLRGGLGNGALVNCTDCATIVSTFANVLGCDLWCSRMGDPSGLTPFALNPLLAIGSGVWERTCGNFGAFGMHEVAWTGGCRADDVVYDACVHLDGDGDPTRPPHFPVLAVGMPFGRPGSGGYLDHIAAPTLGGRAVCVPQPFTRVRRVVDLSWPVGIAGALHVRTRAATGGEDAAGADTSAAPAAAATDEVARGQMWRVQGLKERYGASAWGDEARRDADAELTVWNFGFRGDELAGLWLRGAETVPILAGVAPSATAKAGAAAEGTVARRRAPRGPRALPAAADGAVAMTHSLWSPAAGDPETLVNVMAFECSSPETARELLVRLLGECEVPRVERDAARGLRIGEVAFVSPRGTTLLFTRGNLLHLVRNAGRRRVPVVDLGLTLDAALAERPEPERAGGPRGRAPTVRRVRLRQGEELRLDEVVPARAPGAARAAAAEVATAGPAPDEGRVWYKVFTPPGGRVTRQADRLLYRPREEGRQEVTVVAMHAGGRSIQARLRLDVG